MSFVRPEIIRMATRWAETTLMAGAAAAILLVAVQGASRRHLLVTLVLLGLAFVASALAWIAARKALVERDFSQPGIVRVQEGRIEYFGPHDGGFADFDLLVAVKLSAKTGRTVWVFEQRGMPTLRVPVNAKGAEHLPERLAALPGFSSGRALQALRGPMESDVEMWRSPV